jgi:hypothetical protein
MCPIFARSVLRFSGSPIPSHDSRKPADNAEEPAGKHGSRFLQESRDYQFEPE